MKESTNLIPAGAARLVSAADFDLSDSEIATLAVSVIFSSDESNAREPCDGECPQEHIPATPIISIDKGLFIKID